MHASLIVPISLLVVGVVGIGLSVPLLRDKVPRNSIYGLRTRLTLSSDEIWYPANRMAARALIGWGIFNVLIAIPAFWWVPLSDTQQLALALVPLSVIAVCGLTLLRVHRKYAGQAPKATV